MFPLRNNVSTKTYFILNFFDILKRFNYIPEYRSFLSVSCTKIVKIMQNKINCKGAAVNILHGAFENTL